jgi:cytochrome bd ubiquinol oxidase subunit I
MPSSVLDLSRWQFAVTAAFHMTFPAITVGLSIFLCINYALYLRTHDPVYLQIYRFWRKIFAVGFALGVVSGIVLTFQFGLNWGGYAHDVGPIVGVIIGMVVLALHDQRLDQLRWTPDTVVRLSLARPVPA